MDRNVCEHGLPKGCCAVCVARKRETQLEALAKALGRTIEELNSELDADLTAPDPREEESDVV